MPYQHISPEVKALLDAHGYVKIWKDIDHLAMFGSWPTTLRPAWVADLNDFQPRVSGLATTLLIAYTYVAQAAMAELTNHGDPEYDDLDGDPQKGKA